MTYNDFKTGLFVKYHFVYIHSTPFIKFNVYHGNTAAVFENMIILKIDSEKVLAGIKNRNMVEALCLMAQGYLEWEIGEMLELKYQTIRRYVWELKKIL